MTFVQNVFLGFGATGFLLNFIQRDFIGVIFCGVVLICLFLSYILNELKKR